MEQKGRKIQIPRWRLEAVSRAKFCDNTVAVCELLKFLILDEEADDEQRSDAGVYMNGIAEDANTLQETREVSEIMATSGPHLPELILAANESYKRSEHYPVVDWHCLFDDFVQAASEVTVGKIETFLNDAS